MTDLVFHLGDRKTGSTAIQHALAAGACSCQTRRIAYPAPINHIPLASSLVRPEESQFRKKRFAKVAAALEPGVADVVVVSAEQFETVDPKVFRAALREFLPAQAETARFIAYVRPHAERLASTYAERVKQGHFLGEIEVLHRRTARTGAFVYAPRFQRWRDTFGAQFTLRPMIREQLLNRDVVQDFLDFALQGAAFELNDPPVANESLCLEDLAMMRALHLRFGSEDTSSKASKTQTATAWAFSRLIAEMPRLGSRTKPRLHKALAQEVVEFYRADAKALDAEFFDGTPMSDALEAAPGKAVDAAQSVRAEDHFTNSELRTLDAWTLLVSEMLRMNPDGWPKYFKRTQRKTLAAKRRAVAGTRPT